MLMLWIAGIILALILLRYLWLLFKRVVLILKIKMTSPQQIIFTKNIFTSIIFPKGKVDFTLIHRDKVYDITILTTPFRRVRYHFVDNKKLEIIRGRGRLYLARGIYSRSGVIQLNHVYTVKKYSFIIVNENKDTALRYVILHPAPNEVSKAEETRLVSLYDGDILYDDIKICGLKYFINEVLLA